MRNITKVNNIGLDKLNNAEFTNFCNRFVELIQQATPDETPGTGEALGMDTEDVEQFETELATMTDLVAQSRTSNLTAQLAELDKERDDLVVYLIGAVRTAKASPLAAQRQAAVALYNVLKPYVGCQRLANQQETAAISGLVADLSKTETAAQVGTLSLTEVLNELDQRNASYATLTSQRTDEQSAARLEESKSVRTRMNALYDCMTTLAFVQSVAQPTDITAAFVRKLNALIDETTALYNQRMAQVKRQSAKGEE